MVSYEHFLKLLYHHWRMKNKKGHKILRPENIEETGSARFAVCIKKAAAYESHFTAAHR